MEEIKRVLLTRRRILVLVVLLLFSVFQFAGDNKPANSARFRQESENYLTEYKDVPLDEVIETLDSMVRSGNNVDFTVLGVGGSAFYDQVEYIRGFPDYLAGIQKRADQMGTVSIFANADPGIKKTAADYARLEGIELSLGHDHPVTSVMYFTLSDWLLNGYILVVVLSFLSERRRGLWNVVCASRRGRVTLACWRLIALFLAAILGGILFTAAEVLYSYGVHGGFDEMGRMIQSVSMFQTLTIPMTVGQFWLFYTGLRIVGAFVVGMVCWLFFQLISDRRMATISVALFVGLEWVLYELLPEGKLLKAVNLFTYLSPRDLVLTYTNLAEFGAQVSHMAAALAAAAAVTLAGTVIVFLCARYRKPTGGYGWITRVVDTWQKITAPMGYHVHQFFHETHKLLIVGRGIIVMLVALYLAFSIAERPFLNDNLVSTELEAYFRQSQGPLADGREDYVKKQEEKLASQHAAAEELEARYLAGEITPDAYQAEMFLYSDLHKKTQAFEEYKIELAVLQEMENGYILPHWVYSELLGVSGSTTRSLQFLCLLTVLLIGVLYTAAEAQTGMTKSRRATPKGRSRALLARHGAGWLIATVITLVAYILQFFLLWDSYGTLPYLEAPINCLIYFRDMSGSVSILGYWVMTVLARTLAMWGWSSLLLWLGDRLQK